MLAMPFLIYRSNLLYERTSDEEASAEGGFVLLYPKRTSLAKRLHTDDEKFLDFVSQLLQMDPTHRPTAQEALNHPWLVEGLRGERETTQEDPGDDEGGEEDTTGERLP